MELDRLPFGEVARLATIAEVGAGEPDRESGRELVEEPGREE